MSQKTLYTVGHSTRTWGAFVGLLKGWRIEELVDVRKATRRIALVSVVFTGADGKGVAEKLD